VAFGKAFDSVEKSGGTSPKKVDRRGRKRGQSRYGPWDVLNPGQNGKKRSQGAPRYAPKTVLTTSGYGNSVKIFFSGTSKEVRKKIDQIEEQDSIRHGKEPFLGKMDQKKEEGGRRYGERGLGEGWRGGGVGDSFGLGLTLERRGEKESAGR